MQREQLLDYMASDIYTPLTAQELCEVFDVERASEFRDFVKLLNQMEDSGEIMRTKNNRYALPEQMNLIVGRLQMKARGFGFVIPEQESEADIYIPATELNGAMSGDKVLARVRDVRGKTGAHREGVIVKVVDRANERIVGKIALYAHHAFVTPLDKRFADDIFVPKEDAHGAHDGYVVVVELTSYPSATHGPVGRVVEVLGHPDEPGVDILSVIRKYGLPEQFPEQVLRAAEAIPIEIDPAEIAKRRDLRGEVIVTIDGDDAKDLDDAVHVKVLENGHYELGVHIADVGYYVQEGSVIDKEAFRRGTSVYLVDRVIPMLPQRLSNNICSLNPQVDRLTMSCVMEIDEQGRVVHHDIFPSVIRTAARMTYNNVRRILVDQDPELRREYESLVPMFELMEQLALILREKRMRRGAVDFDFDEIYVKVNDLGEPVDIVPRQRSIAERLIEEFMLAANETVAEHFHWLGVPFVYRIHEEPDAAKMLDLNAFLHNFGYHLKGVGGSKVHPRALQEVLNEVEGTREARMISTVMLRSMQQAKYRPECTGHFGLAADYYTHFTSPIRRYPDLTIHRIMREVLSGGLSPEREEKLREFVAEASRQSSERERIAQDAEREVDQLKMVEYMQAHLDEEFDGIITSATQFGLFVQLDNGVEGLIHISALDDDYYVLNERQMALIGERTRRVFRIGDPVRVVVTRASKEDLRIDFGLVAHLREATYVGGAGGEAIVYDEDLSPKERRESIRRRESMSSERGGRQQRDRGIGGRGKRDRLRGKTVRGGYDRAGRRRDAVPSADHEDPIIDVRHAASPPDMPYDEWDAEFPDPRALREAEGGRGKRQRQSADERFAKWDRETGGVGDRTRGERRTGGYRTWPTRGEPGVAKKGPGKAKGRKQSERAAMESADRPRRAKSAKAVVGAAAQSGGRGKAKKAKGKPTGKRGRR
ncbi:ribonuclease R [Alicyclobacillus hesperidum URH17-3-68]|uniref:ribonuclease R n=1 Tax=Alicyclobacillus hesperidum TaxID=89784 RepID=UPI000281C489|nr:ribonuclease R [Alicyclobacillus hesperidum]EJY54529.1 ribonuclease R [Alicyclobacillus hesperidum URH17-3-68]